MYTPPLFREDDPAVIRRMIRDAPFATLVTATAQGLMGTPLPLFFADEEQQSVLYGHVARANPQCKLPPTGEALAIFSGPNAYVTPSWYESKRAHGKVVPTWNYLAVHAYGQVEFFEDAVRLLDVVRKLTDLHEAPRAAPWAVSDAPDDFIAAQLKGIVGVRLVVSRLEGKRKLSQNRPQADREGVVAGLAQSDDQDARILSDLIRRDIDKT
jgi:transcriptional regulator